MSAIVLACRDEPVAMDAERLAAIYVEMGDSRANAAVSRAMTDLSQTLDRLRTGIALGGSPRDIRRLAGHIRDIAEPLGLSSLSVAACNLADAAQAGQPVAIFATLARLERVATRSLKMVWDIHDLSG